MTSTTYILVHENVFGLVVELQKHDHVVHGETRDVLVHFAVLRHALDDHPAVERHYSTFGFIRQVRFLFRKKYGKHTNF